MHNDGKEKLHSVATANDVARLAGVSRSAVSRTFTPGSSVSAATRSKVLAAAEALNYHVNLLARGLSKPASRPVCILGGNLASPWQASLLDHLTRRLNRAQRAVMVINSDEGEAAARQALLQTLHYRSTATLVLSGQPPAPLIESCLQSGQQVILINRMGQFSGADNIEIDYRTTLHEAFRQLQMAGCQRIGLVSASNHSPSIKIREAGFLAAAQDAGVPVKVINSKPASYASGIAAARQLLSQPQRPDGVFCVTDLLACGFVDSARHEFALRIPDQLSVIGFDDIDQAGWLAYQLTTFAQPLAAMADATCQLLSDSQPSPPRHQRFTATLVKRQTLRQPS
ncbi:MAG: HTH-type transcriptional regulator GalR [Candidatus Erwinia impunctatus]|nr:HTH-type transcriptional regulator GalR [Culicoides impunctatus]